jgi:hypothetical protein
LPIRDRGTQRQIPALALLRHRVVLHLPKIGWRKRRFLARIIPLVLADARFGTWRERLVYTKHWRAEFEEMELHFKNLGEADFRLYKAMQEWHNQIGDMLAYVNDVLSPHGFDEILKDDFAALRQNVTATALMSVPELPGPMNVSLIVTSNYCQSEVTCR